VVEEVPSWLAADVERKGIREGEEEVRAGS